MAAQASPKRSYAAVVHAAQAGQATPASQATQAGQATPADAQVNSPKRSYAAVVQAPPPDTNIRTLPDGTRIELRPEVYYKFITNNYTHFDLKYSLGLNVDHLPFDSRAECGPGGIYFCNKQDLAQWIGCGVYLATVRVPTDAKLVSMVNKLKADKIWIDNIQPVLLHPDWDPALDWSFIPFMYHSGIPCIPDRFIDGDVVPTHAFVLMCANGLFTTAQMTKLMSRENPNLVEHISDFYLDDVSWITDVVLKANPNMIMYKNPANNDRGRTALLNSIGSRTIRVMFHLRVLSPMSQFIHVHRCKKFYRAKRDQPSMLNTDLRYCDIWMNRQYLDDACKEMTGEQIELLLQNPRFQLSVQYGAVKNSGNQALIDALNKRDVEFERFENELCKFIEEFIENDSFLSAMHRSNALYEIYGGLVREAAYAILNNLPVHEHINRYVTTHDVDIASNASAAEVYRIVRVLNGAIGYCGRNYLDGSSTEVTDIKNAPPGVYSVWIPHGNGLRRYDVGIDLCDTPNDFTINKGSIRVNGDKSTGYTPSDMHALKNRKLDMIYMHDIVIGRNRPWKILVRMCKLYSRGYQPTKETALISHMLLRNAKANPDEMLTGYKKKPNYLITTAKEPTPEMFSSVNYIVSCCLESVLVDHENVFSHISEEFISALATKAAEWGEPLE